MATVDALDWTRAIARGAGAGIGAITNADTNIFTVTATYTTETSDSSTSMIGKDIKTVMAVNFRVE